MNETFSAFIDDLKQTHGSNLVSVILYGSASTGEFVEHRSNYNLLVVLQKIRPEDLRNAHACVREWVKIGHPVPVYFTASELQHAADVFPIEFHQMSRARKVLFGTDVLDGLAISTRFLRHQAEYELRSKLIRLRRRYIPSSTSAESLTQLMSESLSGFSALFRAVLILRGVEPPVKKREIIASIVEHLRIDRSPFDKIIDIRENKSFGTLDDAAANQLFSDYLEQIERVIDAVDSTEER